MRKVIAQIALCFVGILTLCASAYAVVPNCPPANPNCEEWGDWTYREWNMVKPDCKFALEYRHRLCQPGNVEELEYRNLQVLGNCTNMLDKSIFHYNVSSLYELADILLTEDLNNSEFYENVNCPEKKINSKILHCFLWYLGKMHLRAYT